MGRSSLLFVIPLRLHKARVHARVLDAHRHVGSAVAGDDHLLEPPRQLAQSFKVRVPDPGDVRAVGRAVVEADDKDKSVLDVLQKVQHLVAARRVLHQHDLRAALAQSEVLHAPEAAFEFAQCRDRLLVGDPHFPHGRDGADSVIDIIQGGQVDIDHAGLHKHAADDDGAPVRALLGHVGDGILGLIRAVIAALRAAEAAQVAVGDVVVFVLGLAADAVACIRKLALLPRGHSALVDAEEEVAVEGILRKGRGQRAVGIEQDLDRLRNAGKRLADVFQCVGHLAVAVKLVAEKVCDHHKARYKLGEDAHRGGLVALDNGVFLFTLAKERRVHDELRRDAGHEVSARAVGKIAQAGVFKALVDHAGGRRLAVGAGDGDGLHPAGKDGEQVGADLERPASGHGGAAAVHQTRKAAKKSAQADGEECTK